MTVYPFIELDDVVLDRKVMKLLPREIAYMYHALPVAVDGGQVTVAMAAPEDRNASFVIRNMIEGPVCLIQADKGEIVHRLHKLWPEINHPVKFIFWSTPTDSKRSKTYAECFATLLRADFEVFESSQKSQPNMTAFNRVVQENCPDLVIAQANHPSRLLKRMAASSLFDQSTWTPDLLFLPAKPTLPVRTVLLVLPDCGIGCESAASWTMRISTTNKVEVIILPVLPPVPLFYGSFLHHDPNSILSGNDPLGKRMRAISDTFSEGNINIHLKIREGDPCDQVRDEIDSSDPELVIMPYRNQEGMKCWGSVDLGSVLVRCVPIPILLTHQL